MCGIGGIVCNDRRSQADPKILEAMGAYMKLRGPDNLGIFNENGIGLVHRRLSIIDLSEDGNQPMESTDGKVRIVFNGEVYNYRELRREIHATGINFRTRSDTEVLIEGYRVWGIRKLLEKIEGMFAFCLVDHSKEMVILARDRFGQKPLYYAVDNDRFVFCSDIRGVKAAFPDVRLNHKGLEYYLTELAYPQGLTVWENVFQVPPGEYLEMDIKQHHFRKKNAGYWKLDAKNKITIDEPEALERVEAALIKGIMDRTVADVPIACFLSGGVDSGLIVSLLAQHSPEQINTFSVGFSEDDFNELPYAKALSERYGTHHHEIVVDPGISTLIEDIYSNVGEPFGDSSLIPTYLVCKEMAKYYKVALSGDGGDEMFGYPNYAWYHKVDQFKARYGNGKKAKIAVLASKVKSRFGGENLGALYNDAQQWNGTPLKRRMAFEEKDLKELLLFEPRRFTSEMMNELWQKSGSDLYADNVFSGSIRTRLLNDYLVKVDRASMMASLEVRSPFLDSRLATLAFSLPNALKFKNGQPKYLLKKIAQKHVAKDIMTRKKSGFSIPVGRWINKELKTMRNDLLSTERLKKGGLFNPLMVERLIREHENGQRDHTNRLWVLMCFELWKEKHT